MPTDGFLLKWEIPFFMSIIDQLPEGGIEHPPSDPAKKVYLDFFDEWFIECLYDGYNTSGMEQHHYEQAEKGLRNLQLPSDIFCVTERLSTKRDHHHLGGIFASAAFNVSDQKEVKLSYFDPRLKAFGYQLPKEKIIINYTEIDELGEHAQGQIINYGHVGILGEYSRGATLINHEFAPSIGEESAFTKILNSGESTYIGKKSASVFAVNFGKTLGMGNVATGYSFCINLGDVEALGRMKDNDYSTNDLLCMTFLNLSSKKIRYDPMSRHEKIKGLGKNRLLLRQNSQSVEEEFNSKQTHLGVFFAPLEKILREHKDASFFDKVYEAYGLSSCKEQALPTFVSTLVHVASPEIGARIFKK